MKNTYVYNCKHKEKYKRKRKKGEYFYICTIKKQKMVERIKMVMGHYQMKAGQFADAIGMQRSAVSHVLSGRNKPSLDFVLRIKKRFPEVSLDWLTLGKGQMILSNRNAGADLFSMDTGHGVTPGTGGSHSGEPGFGKAAEPETVKDRVPEARDFSPAINGESSPEGNVRQMIFVYGDGTFRIFRPAGDGK